jgi:uncharacterized protein (TIGR00730 family)
MRVTIFGSARLTETDAEYREGVRLGRLLAEAGHTIVSGGYAGIMEAVSRGAHGAGGTVVGVTMLPWQDRLSANTFLSEEIPARTLFERLEALIESHALIALDGGAGTLAEVAIAWNLLQMSLRPDSPVILVGARWRRLLDAFRANLIIDERDLALLTLVDTVEEAVAALQTFVPQGEWRG